MTVAELIELLERCNPDEECRFGFASDSLGNGDDDGLDCWDFHSVKLCYDECDEPQVLILIDDRDEDEDSDSVTLTFTDGE